jgi:beta-lactamase regulating signal transducer with metallopeptidase domain
MIDLLQQAWDLFLFDTLLWTGALIALVMVLRRPVARYFGAGAAYALWFLPLARLIVPPFTLPSWMRPEGQASSVAEPAVVPAVDDAFAPVVQPDLAEPLVLMASEQPVDLLTPLLLLWLGGALIMLVRRFWLYFELRRELLLDARPVGEVGLIRLIETPAISGPMAFGVIDRVVALPDGFMASRERCQRDLAIEHELAHHRGGDLLVNMAVQPLFAIHWFNPLGWLGWHALRRDQEAYCDARVVAARPREERAAYAGIIADFARRPAIAPRPALAAPMACPVLGDKSIIHRLRSLSMSDISPRRRLTGRAAIATALLAVPLTASIVYAEDAPSVLAAAAQAAEVEEWTAAEVRQEQTAPDVQIDRQFDEAERDLADAERDFDQAEREIVEIEREIEAGEDRKIVKRKIRYNGKDWSEMSEADRAKFREEMSELRQKFGENGELREEMRELRRQFGENGEMRREIRLGVAEAQAGAAHAHAMAPQVVVSCKDEYSPVSSRTDADGKTTLFVCETAGDKIALRAIKQARATIASEQSLSTEERAEALRALDEEIAEMERAN